MSLLTPEFLQTKTYAAQRLRYALQHMKPGLSESAVGQTDCFISQNGAGANMSVDASAGSVFVQGDDTARQGFYHLVNDATVNTAVTASHATLPRIDQVVARVYDSTVVGVSDVPAFEVIAGTPTAGAQSTDPTAANYRLGAAALPNGAMLLADIQVDATVTSIVNAKIRDKRQRTRGVTRIATAEARTNTAYGKLTTPDEIPNLVLAQDSILMVGYVAEWQKSGAGAVAVNAGLFLGSNQAKIANYYDTNATPGTLSVIEAGMGSVSGNNVYNLLATAPAAGLLSAGDNGGAASWPTTGAMLGLAQTSSSAITRWSHGAGLIPIFAAAGTYDLSIQFKAASGSVTVKNRKLWAFVLDPATLSM